MSNKTASQKRKIAPRVKVETREVRGGAVEIKVAFDLPRKVKNLSSKK